MRVFPRIIRSKLRTQGRRVRRLRRGLPTARALFIFELLLLALALIFVFTGSRAAYLNRLGPHADAYALSLVLICVALLHLLNRRYTLPLLARRFSPRPYDERRILLDLNMAIRGATTINQLYQLTVRMIGDALQTEDVSIFVRDDASHDFILRVSSLQNKEEQGRGFEDERAASTEAISFKADAFVVKRLRNLAIPWIIEQQELDTWMRALSGASALEQQERAAECATLRQLKSRLLLQVKMKEQLVGILSLGPRRAAHEFSVRDKEMLMSVAGQLALVIENSKLVERMAEEERTRRELSLAAEVQQRLFPSAPPLSSAIELAGFCRPARQIGGDYYDFLVFDNKRIGIAIADVAGKGISAALLMSSVQASLRSQAEASSSSVLEADASIAKLVSQMNRLMCRSTGEASYVTFFYAQFDEPTHQLIYVNAGHNPPLLVRSQRPAAAGNGSPSFSLAANGLRAKPRPNGEKFADDFEFEESAGEIVLGDDNIERRCVKLTTGGPVIGFFEDYVYEQAIIVVRSGDLLVAYTDGVTEALNVYGEEFGEERLRDVLTCAAYLPADEIRNHIVERIEDWSVGAAQHDDLTFIILKVK